MIKINFIANELAHEKSARIKKLLILFYSFLWILSIIFIFGRFQQNLTVINSYHKKIKQLKTTMDNISPQFQHTVQLYQQKKKLEKKLRKIFDKVIESKFILESVENLARNIPENIWLTEIRITPKEKKISDDNNKGVTAVKTMIIRGNMFLDLNNEKKELVKQFHNTLQKRRPFSLAESQLKLDNLKLEKVKNRYYHNFEIEFTWQSNMM